MGAGGQAVQVQFDQNPAIYRPEAGGPHGLAVQPCQPGHGPGAGLGVGGKAGGERQTQAEDKAEHGPSLP